MACTQWEEGGFRVAHANRLEFSNNTVRVHAFYAPRRENARTARNEHKNTLRSGTGYICTLGKLSNGVSLGHYLNNIYAFRVNHTSHA